MEATIKQVQEIVSVLTEEQQQLLKDTINYGAWGDADMEFLDENGNIETVGMYGYCTNDAKEAGHFRVERLPQCSDQSTKAMPGKPKPDRQIYFPL